MSWPIFIKYIKGCIHCGADVANKDLYCSACQAKRDAIAGTK